MTQRLSIRRWQHAVIQTGAFIAALLAAPIGAQTVVRYPQPESAADTRASYPVAVLQMCAHRLNDAFVPRPSDFRAQQGRNIRQLVKGDGIDVIWAVADAERERQLLPVYIPIDRGLIGWRLLLIREQDKPAFASITSSDALARMMAGQGHDWPDVTVLRANGFSVDTSTTYEGLFHMLKLGHIQYFPRSLSEVWPELDARPQLGLAVQDSLVMHYRSGLYFFVNVRNANLAAMLTSCLHGATRDGELRRLFDAYYGEDIRRADLARRRIIELQKTTLATDMPLLPAAYWFEPAEATR